MQIMIAKRYVSEFSDSESIKLEIVDEDIILNNDENTQGLTENSKAGRIAKKETEEISIAFNENKGDALFKTKSQCTKRKINYLISSESSEDDLPLAVRIVHDGNPEIKANKFGNSKRLVSGKIFKDAESIKIEIVDEDVIFKNAKDAKKFKNFSSKDDLSPAVSVADKEGSVEVARKCKSSNRRSSGKMFDVVKKKSRLNCEHCHNNVPMDVVHDMHNRPNCDKCAKPLIFVCILCKSKFPCLYNMYQHLTINCKSVVAKFRCEKCSFKSKRQSNLKQHIKIKHTAEKCPECGQKIRTYIEFLRHKWSECPYVFNTNSFVGIFLCDICGYFTKQKSDLRKHIERNHKN